MNFYNLAAVILIAYGIIFSINAKYLLVQVNEDAADEQLARNSYLSESGRNLSKKVGRGSIFPLIGLANGLGADYGGGTK